MLTVNTIEFNGEKAVINSYMSMWHEQLRASQEKQLAEWKAAYPNAIVVAEEMSDIDTMVLVANAEKVYGRGAAYKIGQKSL